MAKQSLFSILARAPWWMSVIIAAALFAATRIALPDIAAAAAALPFLGIAAYAGWRQLRRPGTGNPAATLDKLRAMPWENFSAVIAEAFRREGYSVSEIANSTADFELRRNGRVTVVGCRRWKVAQTGIGPLRELDEARRACGAQECIYVAAGKFTVNAHAYAAEKTITLLYGVALARLINLVERKRRRWFAR